ncbi:glycosyltransferase family 71 protein [Poronia punctata]|nr:glycosyltransferase family 71 protein [Poronia punctata]
MASIKEGRIPQGLLSPALDRRYRRSRKRQTYTFLFGVVIFLFLVYCIFIRPTKAQHSKGFEKPAPNKPSLGRTVTVPDLGVPGREKTEDGPISQVPLLESTAQGKDTHETGQKPDSHPIVVEEDQDGNMKPEEPTTDPSGQVKSDNQMTVSQSGREKEKAVPQRPHPVERPSLQADLQAMFALLPDELTLRGLLSPILDGGAERMRELGLRTRAYKKYFAAWEKLHLMEHEATGELHIRDDILQYLYEAAKTSKDDLSALSNTIRSYETFRAFIARLARLLFPFTTPYYPDHMALHAQFRNAGRGIVLTAGDQQAPYLLTTIYTFRKLGCDLPIEVMYLGDDDLGEDQRFELEALPGVTTRDVSQMVDDSGWKLQGWAIKPFAILMSSFREVIFIDADSLFFRDPSKLFDDPGYKETGALFFRDRIILPESKRRMLLQILPRPIPKEAKESTWWTGESGHYQESGVVVVDKWRHFISMLLVCRFNGSDRDATDGKVGVYELMHGDKETFWIGFLLAGDSSFTFHRGAVGALGVIKDITSLETPTTTSTNTATSLNIPKDTNIETLSNDDQQPKNETETETETETPEGQEASKNETTVKNTDPPKLTTREIEIVRPHVDAKKYMICSSQLLHLDTDGTPLWFNGWLTVSKFAAPPYRKFAPMPSYMMEPPTTTSPHETKEFWQLAGDNMCCLTSDADHAYKLSENDAAVLQMMRDRAVEIGAF